MSNKKFSLCTCSFFVGVAVLMAYSFAGAEVNDKIQAVSTTLAKLEAESWALAQAMNESVQTEPARAANETSAPVQSDAAGYSKRLNEVIVETKGEEGVTVDSYFRYVPSTTYKAQPGKMSVMDSALEIDYDFKGPKGMPIELSMDSRYISLGEKEETEVTLPAKLTSMEYSVQGTLPFFNFENTYLRAKVGAAYYSDDWNHNLSTLRVPSQLFLINQFSDKLTLIAGVGALPGYEDFPVFPIAGFIYRPNDKLLVNIVPARPTIEYSLTDALTVFMEGDWSCREHTVDKDGYKSAVLAYNETHVGAGIRFAINDNIETSHSTGYMFNRYLKYRDSLGKVNLKNSLFTEIRVGMSI
jgi:outer membrane murein-binding lipoprotein Lpp